MYVGLLLTCDKNSLFIKANNNIQASSGFFSFYAPYFKIVIIQRRNCERKIKEKNKQKQQQLQ